MSETPDRLRAVAVNARAFAEAVHSYEEPITAAERRFLICDNPHYTPDNGADPKLVFDLLEATVIARLAADTLEALGASRAREAKLREALEGLCREVQEWCEAVEEDSSWDGWDHHYKSLWYRGGIDAYRAALAGASTAPAEPFIEGYFADRVAAGDRLDPATGNVVSKGETR